MGRAHFASSHGPTTCTHEVPFPQLFRCGAEGAGLAPGRAGAGRPGELPLANARRAQLAAGTGTKRRRTASVWRACRANVWRERGKAAVARACGKPACQPASLPPVDLTLLTA
jgi:hypothetical protein